MARQGIPGPLHERSQSDREFLSNQALNRLEAAHGPRGQRKGSPVFHLLSLDSCLGGIYFLSVSLPLSTWRSSFNFRELWSKVVKAGGEPMGG
jgi:hypothetical protein